MIEIAGGEQAWLLNRRELVAHRRYAELLHE